MKYDRSGRLRTEDPGQREAAARVEKCAEEAAAADEAAKPDDFGGVPPATLKMLVNRLKTLSVLEAERR